MQAPAAAKTARVDRKRILLDRFEEAANTLREPPEDLGPVHEYLFPPTDLEIMCHTHVLPDQDEECSICKEPFVAMDDPASDELAPAQILPWMLDLQKHVFQRVPCQGDQSSAHHNQ